MVSKTIELSVLNGARKSKQAANIALAPTAPIWPASSVATFFAASVLSVEMHEGVS